MKSFVNCWCENYKSSENKREFLDAQWALLLAFLSNFEVPYATSKKKRANPKSQWVLAANILNSFCQIYVYFSSTIHVNPSSGRQQKRRGWGTKTLFFNGGIQFYYPTKPLFYNLIAKVLCKNSHSMKNFLNQ